VLFRSFKPNITLELTEYSKIASGKCKPISFS